MATAKLSINRINLNEQVTSLLKEQILELDYFPGERLVVETLSKKLGISMTPIREGIRTLVFEGYVKYDGKSYTVFNLTKKEIVNLYSIRRVLEKLSAYQAAKNMDEKELDDLIKYYDNRTKDLSNYSVDDFFKDDCLIHTAICNGTKNSKLIDLLIPIQQQSWFIRRCVFLTDYTEEAVAKTVVEHKQLLSCIKNHDFEAASNNMELHLGKVGREVKFSNFNFSTGENTTISEMMKSIKESKNK